MSKDGKIEISKDAFMRQTPESRMIIQLHEFAHKEYFKENTMETFEQYKAKHHNTSEANLKLEYEMLLLASRVPKNNRIRKTPQERQQIIDVYFSNLPFKEDTARKFLKALVDKCWFYQFPWGDPMEVPLKEMLLPDEGLDNDDYGLKIHAIVEEDNVVKVKFSDVEH